MSLARIAILIDGGYFTKRLPSLLKNKRTSPKETVDAIRRLCFNHIHKLAGSKNSDWESGEWKRYIYRIFYYDALPYDGMAHHPIENRQIDYSKTDIAKERHELFDRLRKERKVALRLGKVNKEHDWMISPKLTKKLLKTKELFAQMVPDPMTYSITLSPEQLLQLQKLQELWHSIDHSAVQLGLKQKGVDMRIGIDIASMTLKKQVDTIVLVAGDSDFVPAAKLARREGVEFVLDPLWQQINPDLYEHIDGLQSGLKRPGETTEEPQGNNHGDN